jgi:histidinol phosphatase-like enzyme
MSQKVRFYDSETGDVIEVLRRKSKMYMILRSRKTGRILKFLKEVEIRSIASVEYSEKQAKKKNPLYIDALTKTKITVNEFLRIGDVIDEMHSTTLNTIRTFFNVGVERLAEIRGIEITHTITTRAEYINNEAEYEVIWKHRKEAKVREAYGYRRIVK